MIDHCNDSLSFGRWVRKTQTDAPFFFYLAGWAGASLGAACMVHVVIVTDSIRQHEY